VSSPSSFRCGRQLRERGVAAMAVRVGRSRLLAR
jgi:hypothetical protein